MTRPHLRTIAYIALTLGGAFLGASCSGGVSDEESARLAYVGLDPAIDKIIDLGFQGFNDASSANIPEESTNGDVSGTITVVGQVDQGASNNKGMRLDVTLVDYSDGAIETETDEIDDVIYDSDPVLDVDLDMKGLPNADLTGTIVGPLVMEGGLEGPVTLSLSITGETEDDGTGKIRRKAGTIHVTGTATSDYGTFDVDVTL
ncbi:MAG: hypothetical protein HOW73_01900 [Polyangiaceae bacterium]|nr:hypothetical protein [Polyangiaceae bacterium]